MKGLRKRFYTSLNTANNEQGAVLVLTAIILASVIALSGYLWNRVGGFVYTQGREILNEKVESITEAGLDKAIWELNQNSSYSGESGTNFGDGTFDISISDINASTKIVTATGYIPNSITPIVTQTIEIEALSSGTIINFPYGLQAGEDGVEIGSSASVNGSVYSNGNVTVDSGSSIIGAVWVAGGVGPDQELAFEENGGVELGNGLSFDGNNDYVLVGGNAKIDNSSQGTISAWIYPYDETYNARVIFGVGGAAATNHGELSFYTYNGQLGFFQTTDGSNVWDDVATSSILTEDAWQHVAVTSNGSTWKLYLNGVQQSISYTYSGSNSGDWFADTALTSLITNTIGRVRSNGGWGAEFNGMIDDVQIWNVARSEAEIAADMNAQLTGNESGLVAYWKFSEGTGQMINDETANGNDGYLGSSTSTDSNDPTWVNGITQEGNTFTFGHSSNYRDVAQSFVAPYTSFVNEIDVRLEKVGYPADLRLRLVEDNGGSPGTSSYELANGVLDSSWVTNNLDWITVDFSSNPNLTAGQTYWIVLDGNSSSSNYYRWGTDPGESYTNGRAKRSRNWDGSSWSSVTGDMNFRVRMGGLSTSFLGSNGVTVGNDLHANTIESVTITGDAYYQTINSATASNYYPGSEDPAQTDFPISSAEITAWKEHALEGGVHSGDYTTCGTSIGPLNIEGDLILWNNCDVTITGTLFVEGEIDIRSGSSLTLDSSYGGNGGVVISSEHIRLESGATVSGSGDGDSYVLMISEGIGPNPTSEAIEVRTGDVNVNDVIFFAPYGTVKIFQSGATLLELAGKKIEIADSVGLIYEQGLANATISSGDGGGWSMRDGTWIKY